MGLLIAIRSQIITGQMAGTVSLSYKDLAHYRFSRNKHLFMDLEMTEHYTHNARLWT